MAHHIGDIGFHKHLPIHIGFSRFRYLPAPYIEKTSCAESFLGNKSRLVVEIHKSHLLFKQFIDNFILKFDIAIVKYYYLIIIIGKYYDRKSLIDRRIP